jgi:hemoglobin
MTEDITPYGHDDTSFRSAGEYEGIKKLVDDFYDIMSSAPEGARIVRMHPKDLSISRDKLTRFLCGWTGGPKLYSEKYGSIAIPMAHSHLRIGTAERDAWLFCMQQAINQQPFAGSFKTYLYKELCVPAERTRVVSEKLHAKG